MTHSFPQKTWLISPAIDLVQNEYSLEKLAATLSDFTRSEGGSTPPLRYLSPKIFAAAIQEGRVLVSQAFGDEEKSICGMARYIPRGEHAVEIGSIRAPQHGRAMLAAILALPNVATKTSFLVTRQENTGMRGVAAAFDFVEKNLAELSTELQDAACETLYKDETDHARTDGRILLVRTPAS